MNDKSQSVNLVKNIGPRSEVSSFVQPVVASDVYKFKKNTDDLLDG